MKPLLYNLLAVSLFISFSACSKKDVVQDEPLMTPSADASVDGEALPPEESVGTKGAGDASATGGPLTEVLFAFDSYALSNSARDALKGHADWMKSNPKATVQIEGHCDEQGTSEYNLALGERRARAALDYLVKLGIPKKRLDTVSFGEERPVDPGHDESAWSKNRRAAFVVTSR